MLGERDKFRAGTYCRRLARELLTPAPTLRWGVWETIEPPFRDVRETTEGKFRDSEATNLQKKREQ